MLDAWGIEVTPSTPDGVLTWMKQEIRAGKRLMLNHNLHSAYLYLKNSEFAALYEQSDLTIVDGFPILAATNRVRKRRGLDGLDSSYRCGSTDWLMQLDLLPAGTRVALVGGSSESCTKAVSVLSDSFPDLVFEGWDGYSDAKALADSHFFELSEFRPDIVVVGMGMPHQESYLAHHWHHLPNAVYATVGGAIDQISGLQKLAPRWLGRLKLEWAWRLLSDPRRLAHRYLVEPFLLMALTMKRHRASEIDGE
ncbi:WecB/TagA/CpsF family glycosyltransferase [Rhodococcus rhodochrous]|uniref:WecB/TagA/CpsF family glycosyltransferase n=1 Tax=Rhodococcus rhodochrous TaxID=1829 RepID=UPI0032DFDD09